MTLTAAARKTSPFVEADIMRVADGEVRTYTEPRHEIDERTYDWLVNEGGVESLWTEGNYSCDCNRGLFFSGDDVPCGESAYKLISLRMNGKEIYRGDK